MSRLLFILLFVPLLANSSGMGMAAAVLAAQGGVPRDGLVAEYLFSIDARDTSGNENDGTLQGDASVSGGALLLDGAGDYVSNNTFSTPSIAMTISAWVLVDNLTASQPIVVKYATTGDQRGFVFNFRGDVANDPLQIFFQESGGAGAPASSLLINTAGKGWWGGASVWHHLVALLDVSQTKVDQCQLYVNGARITGTVYGAGTPTSIYNASSPLQIGANTDSAFFYLDGQIDDVRIYNRALSASEITTLYNDRRDLHP